MPNLRLYSHRPNKSKEKVDLFCCIKAKVDDNTGAKDSDTKYYECVQAPETASKPCRCNEVSLSNENQAELSRMILEKITVTDKPKEPNSSTTHDGCRSAVGNSQTESSRGSQTDFHTSRNRVKIQPGTQPSQTQQHQIFLRNKGCAQKSAKCIAAALWKVKAIQVGTNVGQPVKESAMHINPPSRGVWMPIQLNKAAQPVKEIGTHINPPSDGVRKSIKQNKAAPLVKENEVHINPPSNKVQKSIKHNKVAQAVKESEMHANPQSKRVRKSIKQNKAAQPVRESEMHINPPSDGVQKSKEENKVAQPVKESKIHINSPSDKVQKSIEYNKASQAVKESEMHANPQSKRVRKSIKQNKAAQPVQEAEMHMNPPSNGVQKSKEQNKVAQPVKESEIHINPPSSEVRKSIQENKVSKPITLSGANKTVRKVIPQKVWRVKEANEAAKRSPKPHSEPEAQRQEKKGSVKRPHKPRSKPEAQRRHIKWHGLDESIGWNCFLCDNDLAHSVTEEEEYETDKFPDVAVLPCGHAFHDLCLQLSISEMQCSDPPCIICASLFF